MNPISFINSTIFNNSTNVTVTTTDGKPADVSKEELTQEILYYVYIVTPLALIVIFGIFFFLRSRDNRLFHIKSSRRGNTPSHIHNGVVEKMKTVQLNDAMKNQKMTSRCTTYDVLLEKPKCSIYQPLIVNKETSRNQKPMTATSRGQKPMKQLEHDYEQPSSRVVYVNVPCYNNLPVYENSLEMRKF